MEDLWTRLEDKRSEDANPKRFPTSAQYVAKASGKVCVRTPHPIRPDRRTSRVWYVSATSRAVTELAEHPISEGIERVTV